MKRLLKKIFVIVSVFLLFFHTAYSIKHVQSQEETEYTIDFEIDEGIGDLSDSFDEIGRFSKYGLAKIYKIEGDTVLVGLINMAGVIVRDPIYHSIENYDEYYYELIIKEEGRLKYGLASQIDGSIVIEPLYNWLGDIYKDDYFVLQHSRHMPGYTINYQHIFYHTNNTIKKFETPNEYDIKEFGHFYISKFKDDYLLIKTFSAIWLDDEVEFIELGWLVNHDFNIIDIDNLNDVFTINNVDYITTKTVIKSEDEPRKDSINLYELTIDNGQFIFDEIFVGSEMIYHDLNKNVIVYYLDIDEGMLFNYDLTTKKHKNITHSNYVFKVDKIDDFVFEHNCNSYDQCYIKAFHESDGMFEHDYFQDLKIIHIQHFGNNLFMVTFENESRNLMVFQEGNETQPFFFLFDEPIIGYMSLNDDILHANQEIDNNYVTSLFNVKNVDSPIVGSSERVILYQQPINNIEHIGPFIIINTYQDHNQRFDIYHKTSSEFILEALEDANIYFEHDLLYGSFVKNEQKKVFVVKDNELNVVDADLMNEFNEYGFAIFESHSDSEHQNFGLIDQNGEVRISGSALQTYFNYDNTQRHIVLSQASNLDWYFNYIDDSGNVEKYGPFADVTFDGKQFLAYQEKVEDQVVWGYFSHNQKLTELNENLETATRVSAILDGLVLYQVENQFWVSNLDGDSQVLDIDDFVGRFIIKDNQVKYLEEFEVDEVILSEVSALNSLDNLKVINKNIYQNTLDDAIELILIDHHDTLLISKLSDIESLPLIEISNFTLKEFVDSKHGFNQYYRIKVGDEETHKFGVIDHFGQVIVSPDYSSIELNESFFKVQQLEGDAYHLVHLDGSVLKDGGEPYKLSYITTLHNKFVSVVTTTGQHYTFINQGAHFELLGEFETQAVGNRDDIHKIIHHNDYETFGVLNSQGEIILDNFEEIHFDQIFELIVAKKQVEVNGDLVDLSILYDFEGNQLLDEKYRVNFDSDSKIVRQLVEGLIMATYRSEDIYYFDSGSGEYQLQELNSSFFNLYSIKDNKLLYDTSDYIQEKNEERDPILVYGYRLSNRIIDIQSLMEEEKEGLVVQKIGDDYYALDRIVSLENKKHETMIDFIEADDIHPFEANPVFYESVKSVVKDYGNTSIFGIYDQLGNEILPIEYSGIEYIIHGDLYIITEAEANFRQLVDSEFKPVIDGFYPILQYEPETNPDIVMFAKHYDLEDAEVGKDFGYLTGYYHITSKALLESQYDSNSGMRDADLETYGEVVIEKIIGIEDKNENCDINDDGEEFCYYYPLYRTKKGIVDKEAKLKLEPIYDDISSFNAQGFAQIEKDGKVGLYQLGVGIVIPVAFDALDKTSEYALNSIPPLFDKDNHIKVALDSKVGLANQDGIVIEALYEDAYYLDGNYYLKLDDGSWLVRDLDDYELSIDLSNLEINISGVQLVDEYVIVETIFEEGLETIKLYGVLDSNSDLIIDMQYTKISFDGSYWYLEKYNDVTSSTQQGVWDKDLNEIIPFENKYDNLGEYVGGYAIGQGGKKENQDQDSGGFFSLFKIFNKVKAENDGFVLDVLNEQGEVVGDLSSKYDSVTLIGMDGDDVKALVVMDGKHYLATLVEREVERQPVTEVSLNKNEIELTPGESFQLEASVLPANATNKNVDWSSSDESVATVDQSGKVEANGPGQATITVTTEDGKHTAEAIVTVNEPIIRVTGVLLDTNTLTLEVGSQGNLIATVLPENATDKSVTWLSDNGQVASVDDDGKVTAHSAGEAKITVKTTDGGYTAIATITVNDPIISIIKVSIDKENLSLIVGQDETLTITIEPNDATNKNVDWSSSDESVATVDQSGKVEANGPGQATITVTTEDGGHSAEVVVTVIQPVTKVEINKTTLQLLVDESETLEATVLPEDATNKNVDWSSSDESVATVDQSGKVEANGPGQATITVTTEDGKHTAEAIVTVNEPIISVTEISLNKESLSLSVGQNETLIAAIEPENATNQNVVWSSSNNDIATVNQNGKVVAKARGVVTITVTTEEGDFKATATITVIQPVLGITIDKTSVNLNIGDNAQLTATINPSNANNQSVTWSSSNTNVATVNSAGKVTAIGAGQATITVTTVEGNKKATSLITVNQKDINVLEVTGTKLVNGILTDLHINNTVSNFTNQIKAKDQNASVDIFNASGRLKLAGEKIVTGDRIKVKLASGTLVEYTAAIKGDINGDGNINAADYVTLANHLLRKNNLSGAALVAAYIREKDTVTVNAADYVALANHLLRKNPIHK